MLHVALTGNIGSGKTTVARFFEELGVPVYRADERGRHFLSLPETRDRIRTLFGSEVLDEEGKVSRPKLSRIVFANDEKLQQLNGIIHPLVRDDFLHWAAQQSGHPYVIQEAAILLETGQATLFDSVIVVGAPEVLRIKRVMQRDGVSREDVLRRARHQWDDKRKAKEADFLVENDGRQAIIPQVLQIHSTLLDMAAEQ